jgi:phenylacetate-CoA ligase
VLRTVLASDSLTARKLRQAGLQAAEDVRSLSDLARLPFTTRQELIDDQASTPPYGSNLTQPVEAYVRVVRGGQVLWMQNPEALEQLARLWQDALAASDVRPIDRVLIAPTSASCLEGLQRLGALAIEAPPNHAQRARELVRHAVTVLMCTPTDALRLAEAAATRRIDLIESPMRLVLVTGEPGGHVPSTRRRIEERFGARCVDLYARTELGAVGFDCRAQDESLHLNEDAFIVEVDDGELVVTSLGQRGMPLVRYRTGDLVRLLDEPCGCGRSFVRAEGGVLGRTDQLMRVRGIEILPSAVENIVRRHPAVTEYQLEAYQVHGECELAVEIEPDEAVATEGDRARVAAEVAHDVRRSLGLRLQCDAVPPGTLDRDISRPQRLIRK